MNVFVVVISQGGANGLVGAYSSMRDALRAVRHEVETTIADDRLAQLAWWEESNVENLSDRVILEEALLAEMVGDCENWLVCGDLSIQRVVLGERL